MDNGVRELLESAASRSIRYRATLDARRVAPSDDDLASLDRFDEVLPQAETDPARVLAVLDEAGSPATVASAGGRYFGFVVGGSLPTAVAASWLATAWDQNAFSQVSSPLAAKLEAVVGPWLVELLGLPEGAGYGLVTGATMANTVALSAARHALLERQGWDVEASGLYGAPELRVVVGEEVHVSLLKALGMLGLGRERVVRAPVDDQGRIRPADLPPLDTRTILCLQAGNVNSGAFDPASEAVSRARDAGAWVHVDGAFGLWAAASRSRTELVTGYDLADSWATDAHKWLNVPYDSGLVFCREPRPMSAAMSLRADYLTEGDGRWPGDFVPEMSRRARGVEIWAALRTLGRTGIAERIDRNCRQAQRFAVGLEAAGFDVLNDVVLNQVLVAFGSADQTRAVIDAVQRDGTCWCGGTEWRGRTAMRISVSSWQTTDEDVERSLRAIVECARRALEA